MDRNQEARRTDGLAISVIAGGTIEILFYKTDIAAEFDCHNLSHSVCCCAECFSRNKRLPGVAVRQNCRAGTVNTEAKIGLDFTGMAFFEASGSRLEYRFR